MTFKYVQAWFTNEVTGTRVPALTYGPVALPAQRRPANQQREIIEVRAEEEGEDERVVEEEDSEPLTSTMITEYITACVVNPKIYELHQTLHVAQVAHLAFLIFGNRTTTLSE